ncbi:DUF481 domain-containing protein [Novipirellula galeiformis]|nr:DUF481 domain-containing protein [Novipirellula galeiformis]
MPSSNSNPAVATGKPASSSPPQQPIAAQDDRGSATPYTTPYTMPVDPSIPSSMSSFPKRDSAPVGGIPTTFASGPLGMPIPVQLSSNAVAAPVSQPPSLTPPGQLSSNANPSGFQSTEMPNWTPPATDHAMSVLDLGDQEPVVGSAFKPKDPEPITLEQPPLEEEVTRWYQYPIRWMKGWDNNAEFGINGSSGNADTLALQTGLELKRKSKLYTLGIDIDYRVASSRNVTTEDNGRFNVDADRLLGESDWSMFAKYGMEWDKFKAFDLRINMNGGLGYHWIRQDDASFVTRVGAGASRKFGAPVDEWTPEGVFGAEGERQLTKRQKFTAKIDYFPAWEDFSNFRLVSDIAWEMLLDGSENLSLKLSATDRYDSVPQGAKKNDVYYSLLLLYKF